MTNDLDGAPDIVSVIGLGIMGGAIARNLVRGGYRVVGFDVDGDRRDEATRAGVAVVESAGAAGAAADQLLTSLPGPDALDETAHALASLPSRDRKNLVVAELSTLSLSSKTRNHDALAKAGITLLDCPLSGTGAQAATGDLVVYASGSEPQYRRIEPALSAFSRASRYLGEFGVGTKMKLTANLLVAIHNVAAAEAIRLGMSAGLDPESLCDVLGSGAGSSRVFELRAPLMVKEDYLPATMKLDVWRKDMSLIEEFAASCGVATPLFATTAPLYEAAIAAGRGSEDTAAVYEALKALAAPERSEP